MEASFQKYILKFKQASGTSRGILRTKETFFLLLSEQNKLGIGECGLFRGLSCDDRPDYEEKLQWVCDHIHFGKEILLKELMEFPSIQFGLEQALLSFENEDKFELFPTKFTQGIASIPINGLIWMGSEDFMRAQIKEKLKSGFTTIKMKIGAIDFDTELALLKSIRTDFSTDEVELRVDANGAFQPSEALEKLKRLADFELHSIEQPIRQGQILEMKQLCVDSPLPIALDEELIGVLDEDAKEELLLTIQPQYIILKPSLVGGFEGCRQWIEIAEKYNMAWWITSALESNIGLSAIAQYTYDIGVDMPQGLGTGGLFTNNFESPLEVVKGHLRYNKNKSWNFNLD